MCYVFLLPLLRAVMSPATAVYAGIEEASVPEEPLMQHDMEAAAHWQSGNVGENRLGCKRVLAVAAVLVAGAFAVAVVSASWPAAGAAQASPAVPLLAKPLAALPVIELATRCFDEGEECDGIAKGICCGGLRCIGGSVSAHPGATMTNTCERAASTTKGNTGNFCGKADCTGFEDHDIH